MAIPIRGFETYITRVLNQVHPDAEMSSEGKELINQKLIAVADKLSHTAVLIAKNAKMKTVTSKQLELAVETFFPGNLRDHACAEGAKAVKKFDKNSFVRNREGKISEYIREGKTKNVKSGLVFSVGATKQIILSQINSSGGDDVNRVAETAPVFLTAVLEYLTAEILELAGNLTRDNNRVRVSPDDVHNAVYYDNELSGLLHCASLETTVLMA